jgi:hypothetical protein
MALFERDRSNKGICAAKVARLPRKPSSTALGSKFRKKWTRSEGPLMADIVAKVESCGAQDLSRKY